MNNNSSAYGIDKPSERQTLNKLVRYKADCSEEMSYLMNKINN
jgi:hypothetical protein